MCVSRIYFEIYDAIVITGQISSMDRINQITQANNNHFLDIVNCWCYLNKNKISVKFSVCSKCMETAINEISAWYAYVTDQRQFDSRLNIDESHLAHYNTITYNSINIWASQ